MTGEMEEEGTVWETKVKRGCKSVQEQLPDAAHDEWLRQIGALCKQGESVTARAAAAVGRAVVEAQAPSVLQRHGGNFKFSQNTGRRWLASEDMSFRKKTSSRIIPPADMVATARDKFYSELTDHFGGGVPTRSLVINYDQTFHLYHPTRGFTWEKGCG